MRASLVTDLVFVCRANYRGSEQCACFFLLVCKSLKLPTKHVKMNQNTQEVKNERFLIWRRRQVLFADIRCLRSTSQVNFPKQNRQDHQVLISTDSVCRYQVLEIYVAGELSRLSHQVLISTDSICRYQVLEIHVAGERPQTEPPCTHFH